MKYRKSKTTLLVSKNALSLQMESFLSIFSIKLERSSFVAKRARAPTSYLLSGLLRSSSQLTNHKKVVAKAQEETIQGTKMEATTSKETLTRSNSNTTKDGTQIREVGTKPIPRSSLHLRRRPNRIKTKSKTRQRQTNRN